MSGIYQVYTMIINFLGFPDEMDQDFEAEAANIEPVPAPAAVGTAWKCPNFACKGS